MAAGVALITAGGSMLGLAATSQRHAPVPSAAQAGVIGPVGAAGRGGLPDAPARTCSSRRCGLVHAPARAIASTGRTARGPVLAPSRPVSIAIPAIGVRSRLLRVGLNPDGTIRVPPLDDPPVTNEAAWYKYSPTPGQLGPSIIEGHVDSAGSGPSVFFRLGALQPGDRVDVTLADRQVAVFMVTGVRMYPKSHFPAHAVYGYTDYPALRLITCGGSFDYRTRHYRSNIVAYAALVSFHPA